MGLFEDLLEFMSGRRDKYSAIEREDIARRIAELQPPVQEPQRDYPPPAQPVPPVPEWVPGAPQSPEPFINAARKSSKRMSPDMAVREEVVEPPRTEEEFKQNVLASVMAPGGSQGIELGGMSPDIIERIRQQAASDPRFAGASQRNGGSVSELGGNVTINGEPSQQYHDREMGNLASGSDFRQAMRNILDQQGGDLERGRAGLEGVLVGDQSRAQQALRGLISGGGPGGQQSQDGGGMSVNEAMALQNAGIKVPMGAIDQGITSASAISKVEDVRSKAISALQKMDTEVDVSMGASEPWRKYYQEIIRISSGLYDDPLGVYQELSQIRPPIGGNTDDTAPSDTAVTSGANQRYSYDNGSLTRKQ